MPDRIDYLRDLRDNPGATAEEVQLRVQAPTLAAVETQFRKCASCGSPIFWPTLKSMT
jgi:hypothetical protein